MKNARYLLNNQKSRTLLFTGCGFIINIIYGIGNGCLGILTKSWWLITLAAYYIIVSIMKFSVVFYQYKNTADNKRTDVFIRHFVGYMFLVLDIVLIGATVLSAKENMGAYHHEIIMITIATYSFGKIITAIINLCKNKKYDSPVIATIRNISFADAAVSIFSLQRSMLVSFGNKSYFEVQIFNILTGIGVCLIVMILGINLIRKDR